MTPLHYAMLGSNPEMQRMLVRHGADVNAVDAAGMTPLHWACERRTVTKMIDALLALGADVNAAGELGLTPLELIANAELKEMLVNTLIRAGAHVDGSGDAGTMTPLHRACMYGCIAKHLLNGGANPNVRCGDGMTPLFIAAGANNLYAAQRLFHSAADVDAANDYGETPLMVACELGYAEMARKLIEYGADASAERRDGETPLTLASRKPYNLCAYYVLTTRAKVCLLFSLPRILNL